MRDVTDLDAGAIVLQVLGQVDDAGGDAVVHRVAVPVGRAAQRPDLEREAEALNARFADVFANGWRVLFTQAQLAFFQSGYGQFAII